MGYEIAIERSWDELIKLDPDKNISVKFLNDEYSVDLENRAIFSLSCNVKAKDFTAILILHYLVAELKGLPELTGEWVSFKNLSGVEGYEGAFRKRVIEPIIRKYGRTPDELLKVLERFPGRKLVQADVSVSILAFEGVPIAVELWRGDDEFGPEANMLFDKSIKDIFCTEDIVVLAGIAAYSI